MGCGGGGAEIEVWDSFAEFDNEFEESERLRVRERDEKMKTGRRSRMWKVSERESIVTLIRGPEETGKMWNGETLGVGDTGGGVGAWERERERGRGRAL